MSTPMTRPDGPTALRREEAIDAGARAKVEDDIALAQRCQGERVAAAEAEVGALREGVQFRLGVADAR